MKKDQHNEESFFSPYSHGLVRVAASTFPLHLGDPHANAREIISIARICHEENTALVTFPELSLSGYSLDDLFLQDVLLDNTRAALELIVHESKHLLPVIIVGAPLRKGDSIYNCAVVIHRGNILGVVPKSYLPNYREFYEKRHFTSGVSCTQSSLRIFGNESTPVPFGTDLIFQASTNERFSFGIEICEDMWVPLPPSTQAALAGAHILVNLSSSPITVGRSQERTNIVQHLSSRCISAYIYCASGPGESSTDLAWDGQNLIYELGTCLAQSPRFSSSINIEHADIDLDIIAQERLRVTSFRDTKQAHSINTNNNSSTTASQHSYRIISFDFTPPAGALELKRTITRFPFVPTNLHSLDSDCYEAYNIQVAALIQRLETIGQPKIIIGVSGGLDSTQALLVAAKAMDTLGRKRTDILAYTMPGFATSDKTKNNATMLATHLGCTFKELDIRPTALQMLKEMDHPFANGKEIYDVTFENVQAGLRTDFLFRLANHNGGIVLGTGDLSEGALGWCTYGVGDHMSHYNVNTGIPKTFMQHLIRWVINAKEFSPNVCTVLDDILHTEISPELIPHKDGEEIQSTQSTIGPYELHDFTMYYMLRHGLAPQKIAYYAYNAWKNSTEGLWPPHFPEKEKHQYSLAEIKKWEKTFYHRFFNNQFKRSTVPNGPKVLSGGSFSPRGDWRMPSDALKNIWISDIENIPNNEPD
ncbi:MAG: NAD(+) synthase [Actinomycetaceae bacterium]|nr:NAD(+) synthase [Actinomycetaceae bacterium]